MNLPKILRKYADMVRWTMEHWFDGLPSVTVLCPTFGRPYLLNEAVESFLKQDYEGLLKMLILNDQPELEIISNIKNIKVINKKKRYPTLAEKRKDLIKMGDTDLCMLYGDDDILMPWAVTTAVSGMVSHIWFVISGHVRYNQRKNIAAYFPKAPLPGPMLFNNKIAQKADIKQSHEPPGFELQLLSSLQRCVPKGMGPLAFNQSHQLPPSKVYYMVRTELKNHMSVNNSGYEKCGKFVRGLGLNGQHVIKPCWEKDYEKIFKFSIHRYCSIVEQSWI